MDKATESVLIRLRNYFMDLVENRDHLFDPGSPLSSTELDKEKQLRLPTSISHYDYPGYFIDNNFKVELLYEPLLDKDVVAINKKFGFEEILSHLYQAEVYEPGSEHNATVHMQVGAYRCTETGHVVTFLTYVDEESYLNENLCFFIGDCETEQNQVTDILKDALYAISKFESGVERSIFLGLVARDYPVAIDSLLQDDVITGESRLFARKIIMNQGISNPAEIMQKLNEYAGITRVSATLHDDNKSLLSGGVYEASALFELDTGEILSGKLHHDRCSIIDGTLDREGVRVDYMAIYRQMGLLYDMLGYHYAFTGDPTLTVEIDPPAPSLKM